MEIIVKENRQLIIKDAENTQNENDIQNIKLIVPPQYEDFDKKIAFVTEEGVKWGLVENNMYKLERSITKFENVLIYVWLTKDDQDFRSVEEALTFNKNHKVDGEITPEEQTDMERVISILESEITKTENLESQVDGKLEEIDTAIDNVNSAIQETENLDLDAEKVNKTTTVTITKKDGTEKNVSIQDGQDGYTPVKGVDYFTSQEQQEMEDNVFGRVNPRIEEAETIRQANEAIRVEAETQRSLQEQSRQSEESTRQNNETARIEAEELRQQNEAERVEAEQTRSQTFTNQMGAVDTAIAGIHTSQDAYDQNAQAKTEAFNTNATNKMNAYNENASEKIAEYDEHVHDYEAELANKVDKVQGKGLSTNDYDNTEKGKVQANTEARHTHSNKSVLDGTTASYTEEKDAKLDELENYDDSELREEIEQNATDIENVEKRVDLLEDVQSMETMSWKQIQAIVQAGKATTYFKIGDQIITKWKDTYTNTEYEIPLDVVSFEDVTIDDNGTERTVPGMILQWHYCSPFGVQFSQNQAFYYCTEALPAGKYYFTIGTAWGTHCHKDYMYEFETTQAIPAGGQIQIGTASSEVSALPDTNPTNWRVRTYSSAESTTPLEILSLTEYQSGTPTGTSLGSLLGTTKYNTTLNNLYSSGYGNNRWKTSALRQYLNSSANAGSWFELPNDDVFARKPAQLSSKNGFLSGVDAELLEILQPVKIATALNTNRDSERGTWEYTYDKFFIPALEQVYCVPQIAGEGTYWDYWKQKSGLSSPNAQYSTNANMITYAAENHSSAQTARLRSAHRGNSGGAWCILSSGSVIGYYGAASACRFSPACVIC